MKKLFAIFLVLTLMLAINSTVFAESGESKVTVEVNSTNISVTLPLDITITALVDGGDATAPNNYQIVNGSAIPIKVDTIAVALNDATNWAFKADPIAAGADPATDGVNDIYLSVNGVVLKVQGATKPGNADIAPYPWNIAAGATLNLPLVCSTSKLDQTENANNLITITYVVSAGSHPVT